MPRELLAEMMVALYVRGYEDAITVLKYTSEELDLDELKRKSLEMIDDKLKAGGLADK
jgi:hypothetical protein